MRIMNFVNIIKKSVFILHLLYHQRFGIDYLRTVKGIQTDNELGFLKNSYY